MKHQINLGSLMIILFVVAVVLAIGSAAETVESANVLALEANAAAISWTHLSSTNGDLEPPSGSTEQTASLILDINKDGLNDFVIGARKAPGPALVWYERKANGWTRHVIESADMRIEAGGAYYDIDGDNDLDIVMGGDGTNNQVWWWENPYPNYGADWTRRLIKNAGSDRHHDQMFGDFDDDSQTELVFWNQEAGKLILAEIPNNPLTAGTWNQRTIYSWSGGPSHEGLDQADIDLDGVIDIVGAGRWFKLNGNGNFSANMVASGMEYTRAAAGQLVKGGRPEIVFGPGDVAGPLIWYEWNGNDWVGTQLLTADVDHGHSLQIVDVDKDSNLDIFVAEMRVNNTNANAKIWIFFGDGNGNFTKTEVATGYGNHESRVGDLDGDGDMDILGKPYNWQTPRLDIWINNSSGGSCEPSLNDWQRHVIDGNRPERAIFVFPGDLSGDGLADVVSGAWWYENPGNPSGNWQRKTIGSPLNNAAAVYDFDNDGDLDVLGTKGVGSTANDEFVWARNNGSGNFTILNNVDAGDGDFLQGVAVDEFVNGNTEVALSWHRANKGIQMLDVPTDPSNGTWSWRQISTTSQDEDLSSGDIDRDGDRDLLLGTKWLRNNADAGSGSDWAVGERPYRVLATVDMDGYARSDAPADIAVDFTALLSSAGNSGAFDPNSIRVVEVDGSNNVLNISVPFQFDPDAAYDANSNAAGTVIIMLEGQSTQNANRRYHIYFDSLNGQAATAANVTPQVILTDSVQDEGQASYKVETNSATYYYHKTGGGFSSLEDSSGNDWINHSSATGSAGDFRGIPNLVHPNDGGYFHPGRTGLVSTILSQGPLKATFHTRTSDSLWETMWEIYPDHARMTVLKADKNYWFLYEGTPGGLLETGTDIVVRSNGDQTTASQSWSNDIPAPEWVFFGDPNVNRSLYFVHHEDDTEIDSYSAMNDEMTVFGFGRDGNSRFISQVPSHFTLGFSDGTGVSTVETALDSAYRPFSITLGSTEEQTSASSSGPWSSHNLFNTGSSPDRNQLADMNGDGRLDAVVGYEAINVQGKLAWYEQPNTATNLWNEHVIANDVIGPMSLDVADMDGDGDIDVVVGEHDMSTNGTPRMLVYEHPGSENGAWTQHVVHTGDEHHDGAQLVDIDNDGDLDIISIGWGHNDVLLYENQGCTGGGGTQPTNTPSPPPTDTPVPPTNTPVAPTATPGPGSDTSVIYVSSTTNGNAGGVAFSDEDIIAYDRSTGTWSLFLDGSDVGLTGSNLRDIDAFDFLDDGSIIFSIYGSTTVPDVGTVDDSDIIRFIPTSTGKNTAGTFSLYFDGSDVDLGTDAEDIVAISHLANGDLILSVLGNWSVGNLSGGDEDLLQFTPTSLGEDTSGAWSLFFDGSDVNLNNSGYEDIWGAWVDNANGEIYLNTKGAFSVAGASGDGADIFKCWSTNLGENTSCSFQMEWDGSDHGIGGELVDGIKLGPAVGGTTPVDTPTPTNTPTPPSEPPGNVDGTIYISSSTIGKVGGVAFADEDILAFDPAAATWSLYFDGSDVGLNGSGYQDIDAFDILQDGSILFSVVGDTTVNDIGAVDESDVIKFVPTSIGSNTAGAFSLYFDGSDVGLTKLSEDIDAIKLLADGDLIVSTSGGAVAGGLTTGDEDLRRFRPSSTGENTAGSWSLFFDGSDVGLDDTVDEDIWGAGVNAANGEIYLSTKGVFSVPGVSGNGADILSCSPVSLGENTSCSFQLAWDGSANGISGEIVDAITLNLSGNTPPPPPASDWSYQDIGAVGIPGSTNIDGGTITVVASGSDIWDNTDQFHFVHQPLNGDGEIIARVVSQTNSDSWAKAGVMVRESLAGDARHAMAVVTPGFGVRMQWRDSTGGSSGEITGASGSPPIWLRLVRSGNQFEAYRSTDGVSWGAPYHTQSITMAQNIYVGLAVTAHTNSQTSQVVFSDIQVIN